MKQKTLIFVFTMFVTAVSLAACGGEEPEAAAVATAPVVTPTLASEDLQPTRGQATVESIEVQLLESFPVQVNVVARGVLPDSCTEIDQAIAQRNDDTFQVALTTLRQPDAAGCDAAEVPFTETVALDVLDLPAGAYNVSVNGITGSFTLDADNSAAQEETPEPTAEASPTAAAEGTAGSISGVVWHDLCAIAGGEGGAETEPSEGCVETANGGFEANGTLEDGEPGIEGVQVSLGEGECPADGLATATTAADGTFIFTELEPGAYCVSVDVETESNTEILIPGGWTFPESQVAETAVTLEPGGSVSDVNFGWDYQFLPVPEVDLENCTNIITFLGDVNVPDDTQFSPGTEFTKTWRLRNGGTCPWTTDYSLVPVGGDEIPGPESVPLEEVVAPGQTVELSVDLTAPEELGTYRTNWQLADPNGEPFGIGGNPDEAFWLQIEVVEAAEPTPTVAPNSAAIGGVVWEDVCATGVGSCVETAEGSGIFRGDGTFNANEQGIPGITLQLSEGICPADGFVPDESIVDLAVTDEEGVYSFTGLPEGTYCVSIAVFDEENVNLLVPGTFTYPFFNVGLVGVVLDPGEQQLEVDFGWDYADD